MRNGEKMKQNLSLSAYLYSLRFYILFVSILFIGSIVFGYMGFLSDTFSETLEWIRQLSENIQDFTQEYPSWIIFFAFFTVLFLNNSFTCFLSAILIPLIGIVMLLMASFLVVKILKLNFLKYLSIILIIILGLPIIMLIILGLLMCGFPMFSAFINGGLLGWFAQEEGLVVFLAISPHGIFEIPAFLLSASIGLRLGREVLKRKGERHLKEVLGDGLRVYLILILPLLLIAALIESALIVAITNF